MQKAKNAAAKRVRLQRDKKGLRVSMSKRLIKRYHRSNPRFKRFLGEAQSSSWPFS